MENDFAEDLALSILAALRGRKGFNHLLGALEEDIYAEIVEEIRSIIQHQLDISGRA